MIDGDTSAYDESLVNQWTFLTDTQELPMLGQDADVADPVTGESVKMIGKHREFVCRQPFPSMLVFF
jgi:hypothetical protein